MEPIQKLADKNWRIYHLYTIVGLKGKEVVFTPNKHQAEVAANRTNRIIILKARQLGFTTYACIDMLDEAIFRPLLTGERVNAVIIAHEFEAMNRIFSKIKLAWDRFDKNLAAYLGIQVTKLNTTEIEFSNGSRISVSLSSRSDTVNMLHVSEFGKICAKYPIKAQEIVTGAFPSVPTNGQITIESTAEGEDGYFHSMFWEAWERGQPQNVKQYKAFFFSWTLEASYSLPKTEDLPVDLKKYQIMYGLSDEQMSWYFEESKTQKQLMKQEYPTTPDEAFLASGRKVFDHDVIKFAELELKDKRAKGEVAKPEVVGDWVYFVKYNPKHRYAMGVDVAEGIGLDSSAIVIMDFSTPKPTTVARYVNKFITPEVLPYEIVAGARAYGNPIVAVERNNHGRGVLAILRELYANIYSEVRKDRFTDKETEVLGFLSTSASRPRIVFNMRGAMEDRIIDILDERLLREARTFDHSDLPVVKLDPETSRHFDVLMAACICYEMKDHVGGIGGVRMVEEDMRNPHSIMQ